MADARQKNLGGRFTGRAAIGSLMMTAALAACAGDPGPHPELPFMGITTRFQARNMCSEGLSPEIVLRSAPAGTALYRLQVTSVGVLSAPRQVMEVAAEGNGIISEGALPSWSLPCPSERQTLSYRIEALALAANGQSLAYGWNFVSVIGIGRELNVERAQSGGKPPSARPARPLESGPTAKPPFFVQ
jgi:hypothetical protein